MSETWEDADGGPNAPAPHDWRERIRTLEADKTRLERDLSLMRGHYHLAQESMRLLEAEVARLREENKKQLERLINLGVQVAKKGTYLRTAQAEVKRLREELDRCQEHANHLTSANIACHRKIDTAQARVRELEQQMCDCDLCHYHE